VDHKMSHEKVYSYAEEETGIIVYMHSTIHRSFPHAFRRMVTKRSFTASNTLDREQLMVLPHQF